MTAFRFLTAGESHGPALAATLEGIPAGVPVTADAIAADLQRRQRGYGRGARQVIEQDRAEILAGVRHGRSIGSPILLLVRNRDWENWTRVMQVEPLSAAEAAELEAMIADGNRRAEPITRLRPGHADLAGAMKYGFDDVRPILERASAPRDGGARRRRRGRPPRSSESSGSTAWSFTAEVGGVAVDPAGCTGRGTRPMRRRLRCAGPAAEERMIAAIDAAAERRRHGRRHLRDVAHRRADRPRQPRAVGPQAGRRTWPRP